jgi:hypothetical protein
MVEFSKGKGFCFFSNDVVCVYRTSDKSGFMARCESCKHFKEFVRCREEEEQEFWDEVDRIRTGEVDGR